MARDEDATVTVQEATLHDAAAITQIGRDTFATTFGHSMPAADLKAYLVTSYALEAITAELEDTQNNAFYVARLPDDTVAGFVQLKRGTTEPCLPADLSLIEINRIYVSVGHHGLGIGGKLMKRALHEAKVDRSCQGVWLGVWEENVLAQKVYANYGFTERVGEHSFVMGDCVQTDWILLKRF